MKKFPLGILALTCISGAGVVSVGGRVPPIHNVSCAANPDADFSRDGDDVVLATCTVSENEPWFQETFRFGWNDAQHAGAQFTAISFRGLGGMLGKGLAAPNDPNILPALQDGAYVWAPGEQGSATVDYQVEFRASWKAVAADRGRPEILVTAVSGAGD